MRLLTIIACCLFLVGCPTTPEPQLPRTHISSTVPPILPPPNPNDYINSFVERDVVGAGRYLDALSGYQEYLSGHIRYIEIRYGVRFDRRSSELPCRSTIVAHPLSIPDVPLIDIALDDGDIIDLLIDYIELLRNSVSNYNDGLESLRKLHETYCPGIPHPQ